MNMATFIGSTQGGILRFICCNAGRGVAVIFDYSLNCIRTKESDEICTRQRLFIGSSSVRLAMILATALSMALSTLFGLTDLQAGFAPDLRSIAVFAMLGATHLICKKIPEKQLHRQF